MQLHPLQLPSYTWYIAKRKVESVMLWPLIAIGRCWGFLQPLTKQYEGVLFFPFYHTGGAEKVHSQIVQALAAVQPNLLVVFTRRSVDTTFLSAFEKSGVAIIDISRKVDGFKNLAVNVIYRGKIAQQLSQQRQCKWVFNGQCNFAYKLSIWLPKHIKQYELIHSFNSFSWIRLPYIDKFDVSVMIALSKIKEHLIQYQQLQIPAVLGKRIRYIPNGVNVPKQVVKHKNEVLKLLFVGRNSAEKRIHLILNIAAALVNYSTVYFSLAGIEKNFTDTIPVNVTCIGIVNDEKTMTNIYQQHDLLILTSNTEGMPMVVAEAMANGCAIIATPVGDIASHISSAEAGYCTSSINDEALIVLEIKKQILHYLSNRHILESHQRNAIAYAKKNFDSNEHMKAYVNIICNESYHITNA
ncbi:MAG: glycosyltransferase family 4 protein [Chitinophagaceae bacterium]